jgi:hypothetical protein|tara:strand:- start:7567 stop:8562 length:996 start_codon:yes stop_codon:yes gene_type:complete
MAQEQTVQGAAKKISGLLNPDKGQSAPEKKAEPSEQPEKIEQETSPESQPKSEGTPKEVVTENTEIKEETQTEIDEPELHRVKVQGQELEVTIDELKAGYSRDSDYRQKTHSLGLERKDLEGQKQSLRQTYDNRLSELNDMISTADGYIRQQQGSKDLQKLYDEDPTSAARLDYQLREQQKQIDGMKSKANEAYTKQYNEYLDAEKQLAAAKIPEFSDPNKSDHFKTNMRTTLRGYGFNDGEIGNLADHRFLMVIKDAMSYKSQVDKKPIAQKKVANAPKVVKSGVARSNVSSGRESIRNKIGTLKKTGHLKDAQNALMDMINLKSQQQRK